MPSRSPAADYDSPTRVAHRRRVRLNRIARDLDRLRQDVPPGPEGAAFHAALDVLGRTLYPARLAGEALSKVQKSPYAPA